MKIQLFKKVLTFSWLIIIDGYFGSIQHHILPLPALLTSLAISESHTESYYSQSCKKTYKTW